MTNQYAKLRAALAKATPGPWSAFLGNRSTTVSICIGEKPNGKRPCIIDWSGFDGNDQPRRVNRANALAIVAAHNALPALLDTIDAQAAGIERLREALAELVECDALKKRIAIEQATMIPETDSDFEELDALMSDLARRQPAAWESARAALSQGEPK